MKNIKDFILESSNDFVNNLKKISNSSDYSFEEWNKLVNGLYEFISSYSEKKIENEITNEYGKLSWVDALIDGTNDRVHDDAIDIDDDLEGLADEYGQDIIRFVYIKRLMDVNKCSFDEANNKLNKIISKVKK